MTSDLSSLISRVSDQLASGQQVSATMLFVDSNSTRLVDKYGIQRERHIQARVLDVITTEVNVYEGVVIKIVGNQVMSCFPDPEKAVRAACKVQKGIKDDPALIGLNVPVKIGLHHGYLRLEANQIAGDAVDVATLMMTLAKADQIITTQETVRLLPADLEKMAHNLGQSNMSATQDQREIIEIVWRDLISQTQTQVVSYQTALINLLFARLFLEYRDRNIELVPDHRVFTIGRSRGNDLVVGREQVSRSHATIEFRQGKFVLVDQSANGTRLLLENGAQIFLRGEEFTLHDRGIIFLGPVLSEQDPDIIRYSVVQNAQEVYAREHELKKQLQEIHIEIDKADCAKQVGEIMQSDFFKRINDLASRLRTERSK